MVLNHMQPAQDIDGSAALRGLYKLSTRPELLCQVAFPVHLYRKFIVKAVLSTEIILIGLRLLDAISGTEYFY